MIYPRGTSYFTPYLFILSIRLSAYSFFFPSVRLVEAIMNGNEERERRESSLGSALQSFLVSKRKKRENFYGTSIYL